MMEVLNATHFEKQSGSLFFNFIFYYLFITLHIVAVCHTSTDSATVYLLHSEPSNSPPWEGLQKLFHSKT